jgi:hypothetical protein
MKLFVDDMREPWIGWHVARTITEAIRILATMPVESVSLDHDIIQTVRGDKNFETFEPVARYIALMSDDTLPHVLFHTGNPQGGEHMAQILGLNYSAYRVDYATFGTFKEEE